MAELREAVYSFLSFWHTRWRRIEKWYDIKYFCQSRFWSWFLNAIIWHSVWIKHEDDMGSVACSLEDSEECPPRQRLHHWTVGMTVTLEVLECILFNPWCKRPIQHYALSTLTCILCFFNLEGFLFVSQLVFYKKKKVFRGRTNKWRGLVMGPVKGNLIQSPKADWRLKKLCGLCSCFLCFFLSCLFGKHIVGNSVFSCCASFFSAPPLLFIWQPWLESLGSCLPACYKILHVLHIFEELLIWGDFFLSIFYAEHQSCFPRRLGKMQWCATQRSLFNSSNH